MKVRQALIEILYRYGYRLIHYEEVKIETGKILIPDHYRVERIGQREILH